MSDRSTHADPHILMQTPCARTEVPVTKLAAILMPSLPCNEHIKAAPVLNVQRRRHWMVGQRIPWQQAPVDS